MSRQAWLALCGTVPKQISIAELEDLGAADAKTLAQVANEFLAQAGDDHSKLAVSIWDQLRTLVIKPEHPVAVKRALFDAAYADWDQAKLGPRPVWRPDDAIKRGTNIQAVMDERGFGDFASLHAWSIEHGQEFWGYMLERLGILFDLKHGKIIDLSDPRKPRWMPGAKLNIANSFFLADPDEIALIYQHEGGQLRQISYGELNEFSNRIANGLARQGIGVGDYVAIDMPMNIKAIAAYIACMKAGCPVVCLADSFNAADIELRLRQIPRAAAAIFTQDVCGGKLAFPLYSKIVETSSAPRAIVATNTNELTDLLRPEDISWERFIKGTSSEFVPVQLDPQHHLNVIFSSSTSSGKEKEGGRPKAPKAIPWLAHTAIKSAVDAHLHHNLGPGRILNWPTNLGWMMGPYSVIGTLINKGTLAVFDGSPVSAEFGEFVSKANVTTLGTVPAMAQRWTDSGSIAGCDWSSIELFSSTGSPSNPLTYFHLMSLVPGFAPVIEYCGGTEIGGSYNSSSLHHKAAPSMFTTPLLGTELAFPREMYGNDEFAQGEVAIVMRNGVGECPPMGLSTELLNFPHEQTYFGRNARTPQGYPLREHGDVYVRHPGGFMQSDGRADDGININGIKTSSTELEGFIKDAALAAVADVVVVAARPAGGGEDLVVVFVVPASGTQIADDELLAQLKQAVRARNPQLAKINAVELADEIPRTASNKIRRAWLRDSWLEQQS